MRQLLGDFALPMGLLSAIALIELHGPTGQSIWVNPQEITSLREPLASNQAHYPRGTRCTVVMVNGSIAVHDTCTQVRDRIGAGAQ